jgi:glycosyltransferase involved in cell wall biosynthesis
VPDHAGLGEYVTEETGYLIEPRSREYLVTELAEKITLLQGNGDLLRSMSARAIDRVAEYVWETKGRRMLGIYEDLAGGGGGR